MPIEPRPAARPLAPFQPAGGLPPAASGHGGAGSSETVIIDTSGAPAQGDIVAVLIGMAGPLKNRLYPVFDSENLLGREGKGGRFDKDDETISREHGKLRWDDGKFHIRPFSERNAISVNGERLSEDGEFLKDGYTLEIGRSKFRFKVV